MSSFYPLSPLMLRCKGIFKLVKATQKGEKLKEGCVDIGIELGTSRTEGCALTNCATLAPPFPHEDGVKMF